MFNLEDEVLGQLIGLMHEKEMSSARLDIHQGIDAAGHTYALLENIDLGGIIRRWVTAFHAALYQEPLPPNARFSIQPPLPSGQVTTGHVLPQVPRSQFKMFADRIALNEELGLIDLIRTNNSKLNYRCCWQRADNGAWLAFFRLELYEWSKLGDIRRFGERQCIGSYTTHGHLPALATCGSELWDIRA